MSIVRLVRAASLRPKDEGRSRCRTLRVISMLGTSPRLRLYSSPRLYADALYGLASGTAARGDDVALLEAELTSLLGAAHAIAMPMARVGIYLAVKHTIRSGQKVIL